MAKTMLEREEDDLGERLATGELTQAEYNRKMAAIQRDYRDAAFDAANEAAERAREEELSR